MIIFKRFLIICTFKVGMCISIMMYMLIWHRSDIDTYEVTIDAVLYLE